jgi:putative ABC transport system permease protein
MDVLLRIGAIFVVALKRLFSQRRMAFFTAVGLTVAVALTLAVPLYADAVYYRTLRQTLTGVDVAASAAQQAAQQALNTARPPFAFMFRYIGSWHGAVKWEDLRAVDQYLSGPAGGQLGLPQQLLVRFFKTDMMGLFPNNTATDYMDSQRSLSWVSIGTVSNLKEHVTIKEGVFPAATAGPVGGPIDVLMAEPLATSLGLQVGETYITYGEKTGPSGGNVQIPVRVAGIWVPTDPTEEFWFYNTQVLSDVLFVPEATFESQVTPRLKTPVYTALWYMVMDGSAVRSADALPLLSRITSVRQQAFALLANTTLDVSPTEALFKYQQSSGLLTILLYAFSIPIIALILVFIGLVVGLTVGQQRNEIAILRSRGGTTFQVVGIAAMESLILGAVAVALGWPASEVFARTIGRAQSFLNFSADTTLKVQMSPSILRFGFIIAGVALITQMAPTLGAARHTIITYKQERARAGRSPWWQRAWLDVLLLIPSAYGLFLLRQQGSLVVPGTKGNLPNDPFQNPLLFLIPALGVFALTLLLLRILPILMKFIVWLASKTKSVGLLMAARHLARTPGYYSAPLVLLVLTLSLSAFTASLATTLDNHLYDQTYYKVGGDMQLEERHQSTEDSMGAMMGGTGSGGAANTNTATSANTSSSEQDKGARWLFLPVSEYTKISGVQAAARVGRYPALAAMGGGTEEGTFMGVDRVDFSRVAYWRRDFAPQSLGTLMNALAVTPEGILAPRSFMAQHSLRVGDTTRLNVTVYGVSKDLDVKIVGGIDLFPSWYPSEGPMFVGNLDYLFEQVGGEFPYTVWLKTAPGVSPERVVTDANKLGLGVVTWDVAARDVKDEQQRPERQGLFGLLSVGFVAAALLTVLGFLLYALFSFRRRTIELGILRAVGLSSSQMTSFLAWELAFLMFTGLAAGTGTGALVSYQFIPFLQVGTGPAAKVPPYLVEIAWSAIFRIYALFGLLFVVALVALAFLLMRMKIFQAIKLGETM